MTEEVTVFGKHGSLVGILTEPSLETRNEDLPAALILNAGLLHRVGPNRLYVKMARKLSEQGFAAYRFDFSGIGESKPRSDSKSFAESSVTETQEAMDHVAAETGARKFILIGICSGADVAFNVGMGDARVVGAVLINGIFFSLDRLSTIWPMLSRSARQRYYRKQLLSPRKWWRLLSGKSNWRSVGAVFKAGLRGSKKQRESTAPGDGVTSDWGAFLNKRKDIFLIYSEGSSALDAYRFFHEKRLRIPKDQGRVRIQTIPDTDHVFTLLWSQDVILDAIADWTSERKNKWLATDMPLDSKI